MRATPGAPDRNAASGGSQDRPTSLQRVRRKAITQLRGRPSVGGVAIPTPTVLARKTTAKLSEKTKDEIAGLARRMRMLRAICTAANAAYDFMTHNM